MAYSKQEFEIVQLNEILEPLKLDHAHLIELKKRIDQEITRGLNREMHGSADIKCYPTWLQDLPTGCEHGMFLAVTMHETVFYVVFIHLKGENKYEMESQDFEITEKISDAQSLFELLIEKIVLFVKHLQLEREPLPIALVVREPLYHYNLDSAILMRRSRITGLEKKDIGQLMREALKRTTEVRLELVAVLNEATGIFASSAWRNAHCKISAVIGENVNVAYLEQINNLEILDQSSENNYMLVNADVGYYGNHGQLEFLQTPYDIDLSSENNVMGNYMFEKMIAGNNLGEIVRNVVVKAIEEKALFDGNLSKAIQIKNTIKLEQILVIISEQNVFYSTPLMFDKLGITSPSQLECSKVYTIVETVLMRSAHLFAAALAAVVDRLNIQETELPIIIGMDGLFYCKIPMYHKWVQDKLTELISTDRTFKLTYSMDEFGRGAAVLSAIAIRKSYIYEQPKDLAQDDITETENDNKEDDEK